MNRTAPGLRIEDLVGKATPFDFAPESEHATMREAFDRAFQEGKPGAYEVHIPMLNGWIHTLVGPIFEDGVVTGVSLLTRDVTPQRQAEFALQQAQRMEALGRIAGGIAHDFNNLLVPILGNADLLQRQFRGAEVDHQRLKDIVSAAERASELVSRILLFGRERSKEREAVVLQEIVREVARFIGATDARRVKLEVTIDATCPPVVGAPGELHQLVTNLYAVQALEADGGGVLRLVLERANLKRVEGRSGDPDVAADAIRLIVEDTGPGMPDEIRSRIFDPFFTTREAGKGTGLGLSIAQAIVTRCGGSLTCESAVGSGARFVVILPTQQDRPPSAVAPTEVETERSMRKLRLLLVDDETLVLRTMQAIFEGDGHQVTPFSDPLAALQYLEAHAGDFDCVLSDETMPGMAGSALAAWLIRIAPRLPVVLISGYAPAATEQLPANVRRCLPKPIGRATLLDTVRRVVIEGMP